MVGSNRLVASDYRISQALIARLMGILLAGLGIAICALTAAVGVFKLPVVVLTVGVGVALAAILVAGLLLTRKSAVVRLDENGYRVRLIRGAGVKQACWRDVDDVVATTVANERCVVLRLRDGRTTIVPVRVLGGSPEMFVKDLQSHLDKGHGYRRIG